MKIRNDLAKSVIEDFISETFSKFEPNIKNMGNAFIAKMYIHNNFETIAQIISKDGYVDIDAVENFLSNDLTKLNRFEIPAIGTKYAFNSDDIRQLITKMRERADA